MEKISIIIPAYNEEKRIKNTLETYLKFFKNLKKKKVLDFEILVVLNACKDKTLEIVRKIKKGNKELKYLDFEKSGKGFAIMQGFADSLKRKNDWIGFVDADMATMPKDFYFLIENINDADGIIASRYVKGSVVEPKQSFQRIVASRIFNLLIRSILFLPYRDTQCGAKIFKRDTIKNTINQLSFSRWAFDVDLIYHIRKSGFKIKEIPTVWRDKEYSKINLKKAGLQMFLAIIRLRLINSWFKGFVKLYDKFLDILRNIKRKI